MKKTFSSLIKAGVLVLMLIGIYWSVSDACTFIGYVGQPDGFNSTLYGIVRDHLPDITCDNWTSPYDRYRGWSAACYGTNPVGPLDIWRHDQSQENWLITPPYWEPDCEVQQLYNEVMDEVEDTEPTVAITHVRRASSLPGHANPHPFRYDNVFGNSWAFIHNGSLDTDNLQDQMEAGFIAIPIFLYRPYNGYYGEYNALDTELLAMMLMKYLTVQNNYYWDDDGQPSNEPPSPGDVDVTSIEDWAIRRVAQDIPISGGNTSINGILTDGNQLFVISKSNGTFPRTVWYGDYSGNNVTLISNGYSPEVNPLFTQMDSYGEVLHTNGTESGFTIHLMPGTLSDPQELRINARGHSAGDQWQPAISVDPDSGSFVAVWLSNNVIVGRWYNQMGMAEGDEFTISTNSGLRVTGRPAIAHSRDGQTITVVWTESYPSGDSELLKRTYEWDQETHSWIPRDVDQPVWIHPASNLSNPTIAYSPSGCYAIAWEVVTSMPVHHKIHVIGFDSNGSVQIEHQIIPPDGDDYEPDIAYIDYIGDVHRYVISFQHGTHASVIQLKEVYSNSLVDLVNLPDENNALHVKVAHLSDSEFFVAYNGVFEENRKVLVNKCWINASNEIAVLSTARGEDVDEEAYPDIATRRSDEVDERYYVCYEIDPDSDEEYEIHCAYGDGTGALTVEPGTTVNQYDTDTRLPVIAIANGYTIGDDWYSGNSSSDFFEDRRMILWQTWQQDTTTEDWGIAGQFRGIYDGSLAAWDIDDNPPLFRILAGLIEESTTISCPVVYMVGNVDVLEGATLTFASGVTIYAAPECSLRVAGGLVVNSGCQFTMLEPPARWAGIHVTGSATLSGCTIDGATTGITMNKADALTVDGCTILSNGVGAYVYAPPGSGTPVISNCTITNNEKEGISLFSTQNADIHDCPNISSNGTDGILLKDSYANISDNYFTDNTKYGVSCYGSSPTLYCNDFSEDLTGEMYLINGSYPVLWSSEEQDGGSNTFEATDRTLITMMDSYPIVAGGLNLFTIYGKDGYYMADMSDNVPEHNIKMNEWSEDPPPASTFFPEDYAFWAWEPSKDYVVCGSPKEGSSNAAQILFEQGYTAEMAGNTAAASTNYMATIAQYPDSSWAQVSAARLFENQRQIGSGYSDLGTYYATVEINHPEDTCLVETVQDLGTQTLVEATQYNPALSNYEQIMTNPPSFVDSAYAAVDYAITVMREQYDSLDAPHPVVTAQTIRDLMQALHQIIPQVPEANHQNYIRPPESYVLEQNYPNPFNATTTLRYTVPSSGLVRLTIYNIIGQKVATLVDKHQDAGYHSVNWNCTNLASGVYFYRIEANDFINVKKMVLLR